MAQSAGFVHEQYVSVSYVTARHLFGQEKMSWKVDQIMGKLESRIDASDFNLFLYVGPATMRNLRGHVVCLNQFLECYSLTFLGCSLLDSGRRTS